MEERPFDHILFTFVITLVVVLVLFVVNPGGVSRTVLEKSGLWGTFYENYLPELPAESAIAGRELPAELEPVPIEVVPDRWDRLIDGLEKDNAVFERKIAQFQASGSVKSGDARALERRIQANEKKIGEYEVLQAKDKAAGKIR